MQIPEGIFKSYDIRGIYPDQLNEENAVPITKAIYAHLLENIPGKHSLTIAVGRDMRLSSPAIFKAVTDTLVEMGANVIDLGIVATTSFYFAVFKYKYDGGIMITASHNTKEYNGLKIVRLSDKGTIIKIGKNTGMDDVKAKSLNGVDVNSTDPGLITQKEGMTIEEVRKGIEITGNPILDKFKVVADPGNALGALYIEELFKHIPGELVRMNFELDGTFPAHQADPLQFDLYKELHKKVVDQGADLGLAPDGDGDRLFFVDEMGKPISASLITALVAREFLAQNPGETILADIRYLMTPKAVIEEKGGTFVITKVGHAFITEKLNEIGGIFAGESSGHYFFRDTGNAESQVPMILTILSVMTREKKKLSEIIEEVKRSHESGEINFKVSNAKEILEALKEKYQDGEVEEMDGLAITYSGL
jgi:phosphomannomutase